jgi:hypothetical protein
MTVFKNLGRHRSEEKASHHQSLLLKMKMMRPQTRTGKVLATAVAAAVTLKKILNTKKILRRSISSTDIAKTLALCGDLYKYVKSNGCDI